MPPALAGGGSALAPLAPTPPPSKVVGPVTDPLDVALPRTPPWRNYLRPC
ncbi:UNVERIFIED_CONTAM: hypothetical protein Sradi_5111700 [Sesamum radiatum]|uniref:Uncharacterized protein n=1 Tax=Sesamum radiatum TaxID=300843 RepID=A0AAW2M1Y5_SESRA